MARTTVRLDDDLERRAKDRAARQDMTFTEFVERAIRQSLAAPLQREPRRRKPIPVFGDPSHRVTDEQVRRASDQADREYLRKKVPGARHAGR